MVIARRLLGLAVLVALLVGGWKFAHANGTEVPFDYLIGQIGAVRVWALAVASFGLGAAVTGAVCLVELTRLGLLSRRYRKALGRLEAEVQGLRALPLGSASPRAADAEPESSGLTAAGRPGRGS